MSRIGKLPVAIPKGVKISCSGSTVEVEGPKGKIGYTFHPDMSIDLDEAKQELRVARPSNVKRHRALHGLTRALISNMVRGVVEPFEKRLEITGVGYGAAVKGNKVELTVGFSHNVSIDIPDGVEVTVSRPQEIVITGVDKQKVGDLAARIRRVRPPEPYNSKGIRYGRSKDQREEIVKRKAGKAFGSGDK
ncbi:50S ribosomal protein L6 [Planctomycetota bacterium]